MPKVYLSPAYHRWNPCAFSDCDETTHNNLYLDALEPFLMACGIDWKRGPRRMPKSTEDGTALMKQAVTESNAWGADVHYVSHTNASSNLPTGGTVQGCRPIIYTGSKKGAALAKRMVARRAEVYPGKITLNKRSDLYELAKPHAVSFYEEHVFHDNPDDAAWFHAHLRDVARSTAKGLCDYFGIAYVEPYPATPETADKPAESTAGFVMPTLRRGDKSGGVMTLQILLNGYAYNCGSPDGDFGYLTDSALKNYQAAKELTVDGVCGYTTWKKLLLGGN